MVINDGIYGMVERERMSRSVKKMRDFYAQKQDTAIFQTEFWVPDFTIEKWKNEGQITGEENLHDLFGYDDQAKIELYGIGWTESEMCPKFETVVLEDRGKHEVAQDEVGRHVLFFKGKRTGFMPEYIDHPVKDFATWEKNIKWRLDPNTPERYTDFDETITQIKKDASEGKVICQRLAGGCMYLRSLMGPLEWLYMIHDEPDLIIDCMETWFLLADKFLEKYQQHITYDELFISEDICYNSGPLISPDMVREYFFPYYQQLISNARARQLDKSRKLFIQIDTDGKASSVIDLYKEIGMDYMSPFEVASGSDVVEIRKQYPDLLMLGGFDKRILAESKDAIDREIDRIMPFMKKHGGYIPTCDHLVPTEVSFENYLHYRNRMAEFNT